MPGLFPDTLFNGWRLGLKLIFKVHYKGTSIFFIMKIINALWIKKNIITNSGIDFELVSSMIYRL